MSGFPISRPEPGEQSISIRLAAADVLAERIFRCYVKAPPALASSFAEMRDWLRALAVGDWAGILERVRHLKRGACYTVITRQATAQVSGAPIKGGDRVVVYRDDEGHWSVRAASEFDDGRFAQFASAPMESSGNG